MDKTIDLEVTPNVEAEYQAAIDQYIAEMKRMAQQMADRQRKIQKLQAETQAAIEGVLAELKVA